MTKKIITIICLLLICIIPLFAQENDQVTPEDDYVGVVSYSKGEQIFSLNAGAIFPLFTLAPLHADGEELVTSLDDSTNIGIAGNLKWGTFVADNLLLGVELGGMFAATENRTLTMIPISFVTTYYFIAYPFEFPIYLNAGVALNTLDNYFKITPSFKPGAGAYWNFNGEWAFGLNFDYWFIPEIYFSTEYASQSRIANLLQISLSGVYHF